MARLVDEGWMRTTKSPSQRNDMAELCDEQYYNGYYGVSKNHIYNTVSGVVSTVFSLFYKMSKTTSAIGVVVDNVAEIANSVNRTQLEGFLNGENMCIELRDYCYANDIINLDVTMYYHEFQTADGRLNRYPRGNPYGDHKGKAYRINRMQLSNGQWSSPKYG